MAIEPALAALTTDEVVARLDAAGVPSGPIRDVAQAMDDAQTQAPVSYTNLRAHETVLELVCRLLLEKTKN